jgi:hypothetical protein
MTTESTITAPSTLLEELVERTRLSWFQVATAVGLVLILLLVGTAYLDGVLAGPFDVDFWRGGLLSPAIIAYTLLVQPVLRRLRDSAIESVRPLVPIDDDDFRRLVGEASIFNRRREWLALGIGVTSGLLLQAYWWPPSDIWVRLYAMLSVGLMYGLLSWFIYSSLSGTGLLTGLHRCPLNINILDLRPLEPTARWSLGIALSYVGGNALSLAFLPRFVLGFESAIVYGTLTLTPVLVFFLNMLSTRRAIVAAKRQKLNMVRHNLAAASQALEERAAKGQVEDVEAQLDCIAAWVTYEKRVKEVPEWPYTAEIKRKLAFSLLLPLAAYMIQGVLFELLLRLLALGG